jgi:hypothetical protein
MLMSPEDGGPALLHFMNSKGLRQSRHQYVLTESCDPKAFMISVLRPAQNGHGGELGRLSGVSSRRSSAL